MTACLEAAPTASIARDFRRRYVIELYDGEANDDAQPSHSCHPPECVHSRARGVVADMGAGPETNAKIVGCNCAPSGGRRSGRQSARCPLSGSRQVSAFDPKRTMHNVARLIRIKVERPRRADSVATGNCAAWETERC